MGGAPAIDDAIDIGFEQSERDENYKPGKGNGKEGRRERNKKQQKNYVRGKSLVNSVDSERGSHM